MAYIYKTYSSAGTNAQKKFTASVWVKRCATGVQHEIASAYKSSNGFQTDLLKFNSDDTLRFYSHSDSGQSATSFITNAKFRDTNAWYHIVLNVDTTHSTSSERFKMWVNGEQITSWATSNYPPSDNSMIWGMPTDAVHQIGALNGSSTFNGLMSHFHYVQNAIHAPTVFGETDSVTGEWKIINEPTGITYNDQSFWFFKNDNLPTDRSGNGNNWSTSGTLTKTEDCPSNVFATYNAAFNASGHTLSRGNTQATVSGSSWIWRPSTLGATTGKYYAEIRVSSAGGGTSIVGITNIDDCTGYAPSDTHFGKSAVNSGTLGFAWYSDDGKIYYPPNASTSVYGTWGASDILMLAMDLDNGAFYIGKNGSWLNSGNPASGGSRTGAVRTWTAGTGTWVFADAIANGSVLQWNWGNGYFGQSNAVSSAGTNASGIGIFEYDVPTGYTALSTKGLNE